MNQSNNSVAARLRRDLGPIESYAALIGILIGAGIFKVTADAGAITGPSVILSFLVLMPAVLATSVPYAAFVSTPLGREPGGEYLHISRALGGFKIAFVGSWLKIIAYLGAGAYLAGALADYIIELLGARFNTAFYHQALAIGSLLFFYVINAVGVRWFGRIQVGMCLLLGLSIIVLVVPGLFSIQSPNFSPFFTHGARGFALSLIPLFFSYAGFESLAQTAGETKDSTRRLPLVFLKGITIASLLFAIMSVVAFGVLPLAQLQASSTPMALVAASYLPWGAASFVTFGAIMAITTSLNPTFMVTSRLALMFAEDKLAPRWLAVVNPRTATPVRAITLSVIVSLVLLISRQLSLALNIAVFALIVLYFMHSVIFLMLPRLNPELNRQISIGMPVWLQRTAALVSVLSMGALIVVQLWRDTQTLLNTSLGQRIADHSLTSVELILVWGLIGAVMYGLARKGKK